MTKHILITQCLQQDFVRPIGRHGALPNLLHIGHLEAKRLMGESPSKGPISLMMSWANSRPSNELKVIHIRDWHDPKDEKQKDHLEKFGEHCLAETEGAKYVFEESNDKDSIHVDSISLNDFIDTNLSEIIKKEVGEGDCHIGIIGVWSDAKVSFLAYELSTRFPGIKIGVCSALTASSSRQKHFMAMEQMKNLLGVNVFTSMGEFMDFLGERDEYELPELEKGMTKIIFDGPTESEYNQTDLDLVRYLFRDAKVVKIKNLDGGFSGNLVLGTESTDSMGHRQVPHVVKIGNATLIGQERESFEKIEAVLGNNAPSITEFADYNDRGAIKYRYASMGGGFSTSFQKIYMEGGDVDQILDRVFSEQLGQFYRASSIEKCNLLEYYQFSPRWAQSVRNKVEQIIGEKASGDRINFSPEISFPNPCLFYEEFLNHENMVPIHYAHMAYVHGDLNGANIVVDAHENVWLIDFFHTHRGHVLKDLIKLENDLLYIFTVIENDNEFMEALKLTDMMIEVEDLWSSLPENRLNEFNSPKIKRCFKTINKLRSFYPELIKSDRDPLQLFIAQMRYAVHNLSFDESNDLQKKWALYTAGQLSKKIMDRALAKNKLRIDWVDLKDDIPGKVGLTILPGRKDRERDLAQDLDVILEEGINKVICLVSQDELIEYGVFDLIKKYREIGLGVVHLPIMDQKTCSLDEMEGLVEMMMTELNQGHRFLVHCVGGVGRSGMVVACLLKRMGDDTESAIKKVRDSRSPRAIETTIQEELVEKFR